MSRETDIDPALKRHIRTSTRETFSDSFMVGIVGGLSMLAFVAIVEAMTTGNAIGLKMMKYLIFAIPLAIGLTKFKERMHVPQDFFQKGLLYAAFASVTAAGIMLLADIITGPIAGFDIATISSGLTNLDELGKSDGFVPVLSGAMLFMEVFVMSMITSFAILLYKYDHARTS